MHLSAFAISGLLVGISSTAMALLVFLKNRVPKANKIWCIFCLSVSIWGFGVFVLASTNNPEMSLLFWKYAHFGVVFIPSIFYHFVILFLDLKKPKVVFLFYSISSIFACLLPTRFFFIGVQHLFPDYYSGVLFTPTYFLLFLFFIIAVAISHFYLWRHIKDYPLSVHREQVKWIFIAMGLGFTAGSTCFLPNFNIPVYPMGNYIVAIYPLIMSYAILKHQLMDVRVVIQKTFFYSFWTLTLSIFYALAIALIQAILSSHNSLSTEGWRYFEILAYRWSGVLALMTNTGLAIFVWARNPKSSLCRKFFVLSSSIGFWAVGSWLINVIQNKSTALLILKFDYVFGVFVPAFFLDFIGSLTNKKIPNLLRWCGYFFALVLTVSAFTTPYFINGLNLIDGYDFYISRPGPFYGIFVIYFCIYFLIAFSILVYALRSASKEKSTQLWYVFLAYVVGMMAGCEYFLSVYGILGRPPLDDYILAVTFAILSYAISKHALLEINAVIRKTVFYSLLAFTISTAYIFIVFIAHKFFIGDVFTQQHLLASLFLILFITLLLRPGENYLRRRLDKRFFKGTIDEISEQKQLLETELERRERLKSVGILAAGMAHEIKNPITAIKTFSEYLPQKGADPEFRERFARLISMEAERISVIVSELLQFARPSEPIAVPCDVSVIVKDITDLLRAEMAKRSIELNFDCNLSTALCFVDAMQIKQAFLNIIMNAIDAMKANGSGLLTIRCRNVGKYVDISIEDTGTGIDPDKIPHLFDPFYTAKEGGTGLGLAITYSIVEKNHGKILVESVLHRGAVFKVLLPCAEVRK